ncbi:peptidase M23 [Fulvitalea axinellae]|uniref:Peptidase M23 n=1 Tax=Fulvitalea axinellae TaxID=1182444 RepID=A0AAU9D964_9BACT|nr:peptidase M23 [Fulvitalea axinellae]
MARIKYYYDTETCKYERVKQTKWDVTFNVLGYVVVTLLFSFGLLALFGDLFESPKFARLAKENRELKENIALMNKKMDENEGYLQALAHKDDNVYRKIFEAEPIPETIRKGGVGGVQRFRSLLEADLEQEEMIINTFERIQALRRKMFIQTKSYDEIMDLAKKKEQMWASIPAIQPVNNTEMKRLSSGYGIRMHPIMKRRIMHHGLDYSAKRGTPIYATGDGVVKKVKYYPGGYGRVVEIDHGFGFETRYAHMQMYIVKRGQKVKRGECIGYVGNTGRSTAPHLHYEVRKNGKTVDPIHYIFQGISDEEYAELVRLASQDNQSLS